MKKRILSTLLALCTVLALLPGTALAEDPYSAPAYSQSNQTRNVTNPESESIPRWKFLIAIFKNNAITYTTSSGEIKNETHSMNEDEISAIKFASNQFKQYIQEQAGDVLQPTVDIVVIDTPITALSSSGNGLWLSQQDAFPIIKQKVNVSNYDHVTAFANLNTIKTSYFGLGGGHVDNIGYSFINTQSRYYCLEVFNPSTTWAWPAGVIVHEFLHFMETWSRMQGQTVLVTADDSDKFGYYRNHKLFYSDIIHNKVRNTDGANIGVVSDVWKNPPHLIKNCCLVRFETLGGTVTPKSKYVPKDGTYGELPTPIRDGYIFTGWYTWFHGGTQIFPSTRVISTGTHSLCAQWVRDGSSMSKTYIVTFDPNGGVCTTKSRKVPANTAYATLPTPTRSGYTFTGWYTTETGGTKVSVSTKVTANTTLYAHWTKNAAKTYTVTFNANGGTVSPATKSYKANATLGTLPTPKRTGYTFTGWYTTKTGGTKASTSTKVTSNTTLYARWTKAAAKTYTVTFSANGGVCTTSTKKITANATYGTLPTPHRTGYTFTGWYTAKTGGTKVSASTKANANATLYARWAKAKRNYQVTFNPNGGNMLMETKTVLQGSAYRDLPTPTRQGYHFTGWYTKASGGVKVTERTKVNLTANQTLYAHWSTAAVSVKSVKSGSWKITVPAYYNVMAYPSSTVAKYSGYLPEHSTPQALTCTQMAVLSNGVTRYYARDSSGNAFWITYTCEMEVD